MDKVFSEIVNGTPEKGVLSQRALLECMAMNGPAAVALARPSDLKILFVNNQFEYYFGYTNTEVASTDIFFTDLCEDYLHDRLAFQFNTIRDDVSAQSRYVIYPFKGKNGNTMPFYLYAAPVHAEGSIDAYYLVMHPDLSKWDMPFTSFNSRELFLEQFNCEDFGTFEWLIDVDKVFWSNGVYGIYEIDDKSYEINRFFAQTFTHPIDRERVTKETDIAIESGADLNIEYKIITAKKNIKVIHCLARIIKNSEGKRVKLVGSIRDTTEQRHIEQDLKNKVEELNHSNKELEEFAYIASHDMQEPLRKIMTFSDRLSEKYKSVLTGDGIMYLTRMIASAENMRLLINDLLEFSRISKTAQPFEPIDLNLVLQQVKMELELTIEETHTIINSDPLPLVDAIPSQMKQLFVNIISNAIKFRKPDASPVISIDTKAVSAQEKIRHDLLPNNTYFKIAISDNGIGFEDEYSTRIFQVFQRLHGKAEYPGSGIGLAICKKIVEYHHGIIYAENVPGAGARFTFILPQHQQALKGRTL